MSPQYGAHNPYSKLTDAAVMEIRAAFERGERAAELASRYVVSFQTIYEVAGCHGWKHLGVEVGPVTRLRLRSVRNANVTPESRGVSNV